MSMPTMKTDWTQTDCYDADALNRVGSAVEYLSAIFSEYGYICETSPKTDWTEEDEPILEQMDVYLRNVETLRHLISLLPATPNLPESMRWLTYIGANDIEKILTDIGRCVDGMSRVLRRSGHWSSVAGVNLWISEMRYYLTTEIEAVIKFENGIPLDVYELDEAQISDSAGGGDQYLIVQSGVTKTLEVDAWNL